MKIIKTFFLLIKKLNYILSIEQKRKSIIVFVAILLSSLLELLGVSSIIPFLNAIMSPEELEEKNYVVFLRQIINIETTQGLIVALGFFIIMVYISKNAIMIVSLYVQNRYSSNTQKELSLSILQKYIRKPYSYFRQTNSADIIRGIDRDTANVYNIISLLFDVLTQGVSIILIVTFLLLEDLTLAIGILFVGMSCFLFTFLGFKKRMKNMGIQQRAACALVNKNAYEIINGIKEIKVLRREKYFVDKFDRSVELRKKTNFWQGFISGCPSKVIEAFCVGGFIGVVCMRVMVGVELKYFVPTLGAFAMAAFKILPSISKISSDLNLIVFYKPSLDELFEIWSTSENTKIKTELTISDSANHVINRDFSEILIDNISWKYEESEDYTLKDVTMSIHRGETVALVGTTGAGKTTLADILLGVNAPQFGCIKIDGISIDYMSEKWSDFVGYVPQDPFLLDSSVRENILFGYRGNASDDVVWKALKDAQLYDYVSSLPKGLDTIVGEKGVRFSGGQRQRLSIARALVYNPELIVFDEATSALDNATENAVMESINALRGTKTMIIIAHRLSTIRNCDSIYEIANKRVERKDKKDFFEIH